VSSLCVRLSDSSDEEGCEIKDTGVSLMGQSPGSNRTSELMIGGAMPYPWQQDCGPASFQSETPKKKAVAGGRRATGERAALATLERAALATGKRGAAAGVDGGEWGESDER
jgi:hypothetical protein